MADKLQQIRNLQPSAIVVIPKMPPLPQEVKTRFPSMSDWELQMEAWRVKLNRVIRGETSA